MSTYNTLLYTIDGAVAVLRLNRPDRRNALTAELLDELHDAVSRAGEDPAVRALLLTGEGPTFCSGQDLATFTGQVDGETVRQAIRAHYRPLILRMVGLEKIIVGAINGGAAGAGASLALACDLRIMAPDSYLLQAFSNIGLVPDAGSSWFMARLLGYSRALQLCIEAERMPATRCLELGLCNRIAASGDLAGEALAWAQQLAQRPSKALGWTKRAVAAALDCSLEESIELEAELQAQAIGTYDHREGVTAFLRKRPPAFKGA